MEALQTLLIQDQKRRTREEEELRKRRAQLAPIQKSIDQIYQRHGILPPFTGHYKRPIPANLFQCPISPPQTTLVSWSVLPHKTRARLGKEPPADETQIVEVPISYLVSEEAQDESTAASGSLQRRPLGGNFSTKLTEYTRGVAGQTQPFRPGGLDASDLAVAADGQELLEVVLKAKEVLKKGSEVSWKDGTLVTAPPGVSFDIGLSWEHISGEKVPKGNDGLTDGSGDDVADGTANRIEHVMEESRSQKSDRKPIISGGASGQLWATTALDDDSLFGESSSGSEDESEADHEELDWSSTTERGGTEPTFEIKEITHGVAKIDAATDKVDDVDSLLADLALNEDGFLNKTQPTAVSTNPLQLAQKQAQMAQDSSRKSWADTRLLQIDDFDTYIPNPAMSFPFELDGFQQQAVARIERSESIFVAAHTSAGKTVCAEYAIAMCQQHCTRAVYTSPIKALSNQKFRDFSNTFGSKNVGLVTGDMQLNVDDSTVLIMTTEILRSMLYRGADLIRDIEWVIFDEVHYVNDTERGVVWEEVIIMLPSYVNCIFLSATTPNTIEFSDWIGRTKRKPVHVIRTNYRPVPLSHFLWAGLKLHKIREGKGSFLEKGYKQACKALLPSSATKKGAGDKKSTVSRPHTSGAKHMAWQQQGNKNNWQSLVKFLDRESLTPTVVFSFSKKKCEEIAHMLRSVDLNTGAEHSAVQAFTLQTIARLSPYDAKLPQVITVCEMCKRGIGIHHGSLLPILKEMTELLYSANLIKVLFATETFAMGVNLPVRSVVFNSIRKHDGTQFRILEPGEYTQMAGRAGRRGIDSVGTVIMCCFGDEPPPQPILRHMLTGSSTRLSSQFRLTYNMILNLLRVEDMSVEGMIKRSFSEFATQRALTANEYPKLLSRGEKTLAKLEDQFERNASLRMGADDLKEYFAACSDLLRINGELLAHVVRCATDSGTRVLGPGRMLLVTAARKHGYVRAPAIVLRSPTPSDTESDRSSVSVVCMVLLPESYVASTETSKADGQPKPGALDFIGSSKQRRFAIHEIAIDEILLVTFIKHKIDIDTVFKDTVVSCSSGSARAASRLDAFSGAVAVGRQGGVDFDSFKGVKARGKTRETADSLVSGAKLATSEEQATDRIVAHLLDAETKERQSDLEVLDMRNTVKQDSDVLEFRKSCDTMETLVSRMRSFKSHLHPSIESHYTALERKETLRARVSALRHMLSNESLQLFPDFLQRKALLRTLGYVDTNETVCVKGRVACEVNTCEELIVTEMVFEGILNELDPAEIVAALSALVYQEKRDEEEYDAELPETLITCCESMKTIATNLGQLQKEHGLEIDPKDYRDGSLKFGLVHVVYEWALGVQFSNICELTLVQEGSIVRCITRLDELCREVRNCARVVGNPTLYRKMEAASSAIKRDIVFASSLYVT